MTNNNIKRIDIGDYHLRFNPENGHMMRWGRTPDDDPEMCPIGPEIADIEISTVCHGIGPSMETRKPCSWCYKSNTGCGENMTLEQFRVVLSKLPSSLTQIAFGIGDLDGNPDLVAIMQHCRDNGIVPNITTNGMGLTEEWAKTLASLCGAVSVSHYGDTDLCLNAVDALTKAGLKQCNIHQLVAKETLGRCHSLIDTAAVDERLKGLGAIVFLLLKPKGDRNKLTSVSDLSEYRKLFDHARDRGVSVGMDSCSAPVALKTIPMDHPMTMMSVECCESGLFSIYVDCKGALYPCSFSVGASGWETGIDLMNVNDFKTDVWESPRISQWRNRLLKSSALCNCERKSGCRSCPLYPITVCKPGQSL